MPTIAGKHQQSVYALPGSGKMNEAVFHRKWLSRNMKLLDKDTLQVQVIGEDQLQRTVKHPLKPILNDGDLFVVGGDDKDSYGDAWFLVITHPDLDKEQKKEN